MQISEMTWDEKIRMYMKLPKKKLIEMLIEANKIVFNNSIKKAKQYSTGALEPFNLEF